MARKRTLALAVTLILVAFVGWLLSGDPRSSSLPDSVPSSTDPGDASGEAPLRPNIPMH